MRAQERASKRVATPTPLTKQAGQRRLTRNRVKRSQKLVASSMATVGTGRFTCGGRRFPREGERGYTRPDLSYSV